MLLSESVVHNSCHRTIAVPAAVGEDLVDLVRLEITQQQQALPISFALPFRYGLR